MLTVLNLFSEWIMDWFDFEFKPDSWGAVISNLGFSNHFMHHHLRSDGDYIRYAKKYMEILRSLQKEAVFILHQISRLLNHFFVRKLFV